MNLPNITVYTDNLPQNVGGCANGPVVRIRTKYRADAGIHAHEYEHVKQWWMLSLIGVMLIGVTAHKTGAPIALALFGFSLHSIAYGLLRSYRLWSEAKAYAVQVRHGCPITVAAERLALGYELDITPEQALNEIMGA